MKRSALLTMLALVLPLAIPASAGADARDPGSGCGGSWREGRTECSFVYQGGQLGVGLSLISDTAGAAGVRLERLSRARGVREVLVHCEAAGQRSGCGAGMASDGPIAPIGTRLFCVVEGRQGHGTYGCTGGSRRG